MLAGFLSSSIAQLTEPPPNFVSNQATWRRDQIIVRTDDHGRITGVVPASRGIAKSVTLDVAAALARSRPALLRPATRTVSTKRHTVPTAPPRQPAQMLHHELPDDAGQDSLIQKARRTDDALQILARLTRILPDDTFLTKLSLRGRQVTLSGLWASAPRLITVLSADPAIQDAAFTAPVIRKGAIHDVFR